MQTELEKGVEATITKLIKTVELVKLNPEIAEAKEKENKKILAEVNKEIKETENVVKKIEAQLIPEKFTKLKDTLKTSKKDIKEVADQLKEINAELKEKRLEEKIENLKEFFYDNNTVENLNFEMLELNVIESNSNKKYHEQITNEIKRIDQTVELIETSENGEMLKTLYFKNNLNLGAAKNELENYLNLQKEQEQIKEINNELAKEKIAVNKQFNSETIVKTLTLKIPKEKEKILMDFLKSQNIEILGDK
jgi:hypothetical protein